MSPLGGHDSPLFVRAVKEEAINFGALWYGAQLFYFSDQTGGTLHDTLFQGTCACVVILYRHPRTPFGDIDTGNLFRICTLPATDSAHLGFLHGPLPWRDLETGPSASGRHRIKQQRGLACVLFCCCSLSKNKSSKGVRIGVSHAGLRQQRGGDGDHRGV